MPAKSFAELARLEWTTQSCKKQSRRAALYRGLRVSIAGAKAQWIQYSEG